MRKAKKQSYDVLGNMDAKAVALKLQRMGRGNDRVLAHITPREARILKDRGGSGTRNPKTGLLEFEDGFDFGSYDFSLPADIASAVDYSGGYDYSPAVSGDTGVFPGTYNYGGGDYGAPASYGVEGGFPQYGFNTFTGASQSPDFNQFNAYYGAGGGPIPSDIVAVAPDTSVTGGRPEEGSPEEGLRPELYNLIEKGLGEGSTPQEKSALSSLLGKDPLSTLGKLALGLGGGLMGKMQADKAAAQAKAVADQIKAAYEKASADTKALAAPLTGAGAAALGQAQQGVLDPARLAQFEAARAQLAQQAARTGGVGAIQSAEAANRARLAALQAQQTAALQLLGPGNTLMASAINQQLQGTTSSLSTRLQLEAQANQAMMNLYGQLGRFVGG